VWNIRPGVLNRKWGMLVLEVFKGHLIPEMKATISSINTDLAVTLAGIISQLQVLRCCGEEVKDHLKQLYGKWLLGGNYALTPAGRIKKPIVTLLCQWTAMAWQCTSLDMNVKGFRECCVSKWLWRDSKNAVYQTECLDWLMICCRMTIKRLGMAAASGRNMKALILKIYKQLRWSERNCLVKGRWTLTCFIDTKLTKIFLLWQMSSYRICPWFRDTYIFLWQLCFIWGLSKIRVTLHLGK